MNIKKQALETRGRKLLMGWSMNIKKKKPWIASHNISVQWVSFLMLIDKWVLNIIRYRLMLIDKWVLNIIRYCPGFQGASCS